MKIVRNVCVDCDTLLVPRPGRGRQKLRCELCIAEYKRAGSHGGRRGGSA